MNNSCEHTSERGSELLEFAFAITLLLVLIFGIIGFAQAAYAYHFVSMVARDATRYASVRGSTCNPLLPDCPMNSSAQVEDYAKRITPLGINANKLNVVATWVNPGANCTGLAYSPGCAVHVQVQYPFTFLSMLHAATPTFTITSTSQMVISQ